MSTGRLYRDSNPMQGQDGTEAHIPNCVGFFSKRNATRKAGFSKSFYIRLRSYWNIKGAEIRATRRLCYSARQLLQVTRWCKLGGNLSQILGRR